MGLLILPPELWIRILSSNTDLTHLWMMCRQVFYYIGDYVDQVFAEKHIRKAHIDFHNLGSVRFEGVCCELSVRIEFNRFSEDKKLAYFKDDGTEFPVEYHEGARADRGRFDVPPYTITVGHDVNDTELPGLEVDYEKREISLDWRRICSVFFREAEHMKPLWTPLKREMKGSMMSERVTAGLIPMIDAFKYIANAVARDRETTREETRRIRIKKWYKDNIGWDYPDDLFGEDEAECLRNLAAAARGGEG